VEGHCWTWRDWREHFVRGVSIKELARRTEGSRNTIRAALRATSAPGYQGAPTWSKLDPFKPTLHRLLKRESTLTSQRIRELITPLGFDGAKTIVRCRANERDVRAGSLAGVSATRRLRGR
jgi:hypothetical protein